MHPDEQIIRQHVATWIAATLAGDSNQLLSLLADDVIFLTPGQPPMNKAAFAAAQAGLTQFQLQIDCEIQELQLMGEWAYCWNKLAVSMTPKNGQPTIQRAGNALSIWRKHEGNWVIVCDANLLALVK